MSSGTTSSSSSCRRNGRRTSAISRSSSSRNPFFETFISFFFLSPCDSRIARSSVSCSRSMIFCRRWLLRCRTDPRGSTRIKSALVAFPSRLVLPRWRNKERLFSQDRRFSRSAFLLEASFRSFARSRCMRRLLRCYPYLACHSHHDYY